MVAHGAILRIRAKNPLIADQVAVNYRKADITARQKAMLDFAMKVSMQANEVGDADIDTLKRHDFTEEDAWDIAAIAAFFGMSNRLANVTSMRTERRILCHGALKRFDDDEATTQGGKKEPRRCISRKYGMVKFHDFRRRDFDNPLSTHVARCRLKASTRARLEISAFGPRTASCSLRRVFLMTACGQRTSSP